jgi:hypothetical protein
VTFTVEVVDGDWIDTVPVYGPAVRLPGVTLTWRYDGVAAPPEVADAGLTVSQDEPEVTVAV